MIRRLLSSLLLLLLLAAPAGSQLSVNQLSGFGGGGESITFSSIGTGGGTTTTATIPGTHAAGDFCLLFVGARNSSTFALPSGFTELARVGDGGATLGATYIFGKILVGGETTVTIPSGSNAEWWDAITFRPSASISGFTANSLNEEATSGDPASQTITISSAGTLPVIAAVVGASSGTITATPSGSGGMTEITDDGVATMRAWYAIFDAPGEISGNITYDQGDHGAQNSASSLYITFN